MISYFKSVSSSENDQDIASIRLLRVVLTVTTVTVTGISIALFLIKGEYAGSFGSGILALISGAALFFSHRNVHWIGRILLPVSLLAGITLMAFFADGMRDSGVVGFTTVIIIAGLITGQKSIPVVTILSLVGIWALAYADMTGINKSAVASTNTIDNVLIYSLVQIIAAVSLNGLISRLNSALEITRISEQAQTKTNQELRDLQVTLDQRVTERSAVAENMRAESESARRDIEAQMWLATGQTQLAESMRGEQNVDQLAENIVTQLCRYADIQAGALFLLDEKTLTLTGRYAFAERAGFDGKFQLGEGLVGQAVADGKIIYLENIPMDAPVISTGLAGIKPRQLAAAPFYANGEVVGALELATLSAFTQVHLELWKRVSESIGVAFRTAQTRQRLTELLMESQQQAEELQAQEEELRAANEELHAQAESLKVKQAGRSKSAKGILNG